MITIIDPWGHIAFEASNEAEASDFLRAHPTCSIA